MGDDYEECARPGKSGKLHNVLPIWGNEQTMNMNPLILANIQGSSYFKVHLFKLKTYHEVVDEIYYQVKHLEPWERGSRKTAGQTGMCGGVRGVGAGGIVSTAYCLLYKLYTLKLTRKQVNSLMTHPDSPFIRALGFMYVRYTQPPGSLLDWFEEYLQDEEEVEARAGGGQAMSVGALARHLLTKLDWFSTLFPRIPVPIQKTIQQRLAEYDRQQVTAARSTTADTTAPSFGEAEKYSRDRNTRREKEPYKPEHRETHKDSRDTHKDNRDAYREGRDTHREGRDTHREGRDTYRDPHKESRDTYKDSRDSYRDGRATSRDGSSRSGGRDRHDRERSERDRDRHDRDRGSATRHRDRSPRERRYR